MKRKCKLRLSYNSTHDQLQMYHSQQITKNPYKDLLICQWRFMSWLVTDIKMWWY